jgi:hypothetical protein
MGSARSSARLTETKYADTNTLPSPSDHAILDSDWQTVDATVSKGLLGWVASELRFPEAEILETDSSTALNPQDFPSAQYFID